MDRQRDRLQALRRVMAWSTADLAIRLGRSSRTIEGWEQGRIIPPAAMASLERLLQDAIASGQIGRHIAKTIFAIRELQ